VTDAARVEDTPEGRTVRSEGWFVVNLAGARALRGDKGGVFAPFEGPDAPFPHFGINVTVLAPGEPSALYHGEANQEGFLVLSGECRLLVEEQERRLRAWDYVHCPPWTRHVLVGAGDGPCAVLMVGARGSEEIHYPRSELAAGARASAPHDTSSPAEAYADWPGPLRPEPMPWPPEG
jgi:uncharacterized cupin superfamily protein